MIICSWKKLRDKKLIPLIKDLIQEKYDDATKEFTQHLISNYVSSVEAKREQASLEKRINTIEGALDGLCKEVSRNDIVPADFDRLVKIQSERCKVYQMDLEDEQDYSDKLNALSKVFEKDAIQDVLDAFNFEEAAERANKLGFTYGFEEKPIDAKGLIKDAISMFTKLEKDVEDGDCGRLQNGRLIATKMWSKEENEPWYMLDYFIEMVEM